MASPKHPSPLDKNSVAADAARMAEQVAKDRQAITQYEDNYSRISSLYNDLLGKPYDLPSAPNIGNPTESDAKGSVAIQQDPATVNAQKTPIWVYVAIVAVLGIVVLIGGKK